jgi:hypothetical protein
MMTYGCMGVWVRELVDDVAEKTNVFVVLEVLLGRYAFFTASKVG